MGWVTMSWLRRHRKRLAPKMSIVIGIILNVVVGVLFGVFSHWWLQWLTALEHGHQLFCTKDGQLFN